MTVEIEFLGIPGSGKSTLAAEGLSALRARGVLSYDMHSAAFRALKDSTSDPLLGPVFRMLPGARASRLMGKLYARSKDRERFLKRFLVNNPRLAEILFRAYARRTPIEPNPQLLLGWLLDLFSKYQMITDALPGQAVLIVDEGLGGRSISLFGYRFGPDDDADLRDWIEQIPKPRAVVVVETSPETCSSRLSKRRWPTRTADFDPTERLNYLRDCQTCLSRMVQMLKGRGVPVHILSNEGTLDSAIADLDVELRGLVAAAQQIPR